MTRSSKATPSHPDAETIAVDGSPLARAAGPGVSVMDDLVTRPAAPGRHEAAPRPRVSALYTWLIVVANFGVFIALVTPIAISLALRVEQLSPGNEGALGVLTSVGAAAATISGPLTGVLSDRTRSRFGRRRPYLVAGALAGTTGLAVMAWAPSVLTLGVGWVIAQIGWSTAVNSLVHTQADRLPEEQRGKVSGLVGFVTMLAPIIGAGSAPALVDNNFLLFLVPAGVGLVCSALFAVCIGGDDSRDLQVDEPLSLGTVAGKYRFDPRRYPDFSWNWLGRMLFNFGVTTSTTYTVFFIGDVAGEEVSDIAGILALMSIGGVLAAAVGALGGGFLSDRLRRRRIFVLTAGLVFCAGALVMAFGSTLPVLIAGSITTSLALGSFSAVDQALVLDVLPDRDTDAGRFLGINSFATTIPQIIAPVVAAAMLGIGVSGEESNYGLLFLVAAAFTLLGGLVIVTRVRSAR